jgi:membrane protein DedA with SNARE-associated domain
VFLARFTAVVRAFVPLLAGILNMSARQFYIANILSALVWAPAHVFPGALLGLLARLGGASAQHLVLLSIAGVILISTVWGLVRRPNDKSAGTRTVAGSGRARDRI